jgi:hypothetical protein
MSGLFLELKASCSQEQANWSLFKPWWIQPIRSHPISLRYTLILSSHLPLLIRLLSSFIHSSMALQPFVGPWPLLQFRNPFFTDGRTPWTSDQPIARPLPTHRTTKTQTSMSRVGFEPTTPVFERAKKFMPYTKKPPWSASFLQDYIFLEHLIVFVRVVCPAHLILLNCLP